MLCNVCRGIVHIIDAIGQSVKLTWEPRIDGKFLSDSPQKLVQQGSVANLPFVTGVSEFGCRNDDIP